MAENVHSMTSRKRSADDSSQSSSKKRAADKSQSGNTGLRHFSMKVFRKVEEKGNTTYNEVADELVREVIAERGGGKFDEKNIRRRVYDALNVLMAMDIISKDKKDIRWKGLPSNVHHDLDMLQREGQFRRAEVERKRESLRELLVQQVCFRNLVQHNQARETAPSVEEKIPLPFIVVNTHSSAVIQCEMSPDRTDVMFDFSMPFEINDDNTILKRLGMDKTTMSVLQGMLPRDLLHYCQEHGLLDSILIPEEQQQQPAPQGLSTGPAAAGTDAHPPPPRVEQQQQQQQQQP
jgi:transcription factor Dp-1